MKDSLFDHPKAGGADAKELFTSVKGQDNLPRYFAASFQLLGSLDRGQLKVELPDGRVFLAKGDDAGYDAIIVIHNDDVFARLLRDGYLGFCEAYLDGWWSTPDLQAFMDLLNDGNDQVYNAFPGQKLIQAYEKIRFWLQSNSKKQARKNISYHYDLGNDFYQLWLDETMTYSAAKFTTGDETLAEAQIEKYKSMVDEMGVSPGDHVLEIGCGWGGFAEYAAKERGLKVTGLTISQEQYDYAVARINKAGLADQVTFKLQDYRDETGVYDGIASIEMFEAVGEQYWPVYFDTVKARLKPGKHATLQIITVADERWETYKSNPDFIQKYIFPGGMLPSPSALRQVAAQRGLIEKKSIEFGEGYSQTLRLWHKDFNAKWDRIAQLGFDDRFQRMWNFYLTSCAAAFHSGNCDVTQITLTNPR